MTDDDFNRELELAQKLFPGLDPEARTGLARYAVLLRDWNSRVNLVSRKETDLLMAHHIAPAVAIAAFWTPKPGARVLDIGTGGGLPGMPLAILSPELRFLLVDSVGKKTKAVQAMLRELGLRHAEGRQARAETLTERFDLVVGRAVAAFPRLLAWAKPRLRRDPGCGVYYIKGTLYRDELASVGLEPDAVWPLREVLAGDYYADKFVVHLEASTIARCRRLPTG
ncbi:MAG: 16S rRNA (guanine(527)-N(7))-methyltransferase RsmG [Opitutales bacterium]